MVSREFIAKHSGVQLSENIEDILLGRLLFACVCCSSDLSHLRFDCKLLMQDIQAFMNDERTTITFECVNKPFCKTTHDKVHLYCLCRTHWIEGTTSKAIHGENQKGFDSHICVKCGNWFHLHVCNLDVPKRTHDFICPECQVPPILPWLHPRYTNVTTL